MPDHWTTENTAEMLRLELPKLIRIRGEGYMEGFRPLSSRMARDLEKDSPGILVPLEANPKGVDGELSCPGVVIFDDFSSISRYEIF